MEKLRNTLIMKYPAAWHGDMWREAMPVGNGEIGALIYGGVYKEIISLIHGKLWCNGQTPELPDVSYVLEKMRALLNENKVLEAENLMSEALQEKGYFPKISRPMPLGDIEITTSNNYGFSNYERGIDMENAEAYVKWEDGEAKYQRRTFISRENDVICTSMRVDDGKLNVIINMKIHDEETLGNAKAPSDAETICENGIMKYAAKTEGKDFGAVMKVIHNGSQTSENGKIIVSDADYIHIFVKTFIDGNRECDWERIVDDLNGINDYEYELEKHIKLHRPIFSALNLSLGGKEYGFSNEELLLKAYEGEAPIELIEKLFSYGRYLLICSSKRNSYPCQLYGLWTGGYDVWFAFNMFNVNLEMIYWQALSGNMPDLLFAVFDYVESKMDDYRENAMKLYGCRGINIPSVSTPESGLHKNIYEPHILHWTAGAGWISQFYYDYWLCTGDKEFLEKRAMPFMYEAALFYEDFMTIGEDGFFISSPSNSPENTPKNIMEIVHRDCEVTVNATMDFAVLKELLTNLIKGAEITGIFEDKVDVWKEMLTRIPPYQINKEGAIMEWMHPFYEDNYEHRHQSHVYPVFPGYEITKQNNPDLYKAFERAMDLRKTVGLKDQSGWSLMYMANVYARMGRGDDAINCIDYLTRAVVLPNLLMVHNDWRRMGIAICGDLRYAPIQIDANMGLTAAILEMLAFSTTSEIYLFNAMPKRISKGEAGPMLLRTGSELSLKWNEQGAEIKIYHTTEDKDITLNLPANMHFSENGQKSHNITLKQGEQYYFTVIKE